ncbi:MAG: hypothetical protein IJ226_04305 [Clostridia bacterium]|nr:hypothetical protein [Clostridia bacterium]
MYTRCPSCRAQISFELPQSADSFPEGYKHKIKCPSCGVTIGVKIPRVDTTATVQPTYTPANPAASTFEPTYAVAPPVPADTRADKKAEKRAKAAEKKSGLGRNICMMIFSLLFVALSVVGYLIAKGTLSVPEWMGGVASFNGIGFIENLIKDFEAVKALDVKLLVGEIIPTALFILAGVDFIVALISAIGKKYGRAWNLIVSLLIAVLAVFVLLGPVILGGAQFVDYLMNTVIGGQQYFLFVGAGLGILQLIFALIFLAPLKKKVK